MTQKLTKTAVARLKPGANEIVIFDTLLPGFAVKVTPTGRRVFVYQYRVGGRAGTLRRITIGEFRDPPLADTDTVDGARRKAAEHRAAVMRGEDPFADLQARKAASVEAARKAAIKDESGDPETVRQLAAEYLARWAAKKRDGGAGDRRQLQKDVLPEIGARPIGEVTRRDIVRLLDKIADRGSLVSANRALALVRRLFNFAIARGLLMLNPCTGIDRHTETPRERHLSAEEIPIFWHGLGRATCEPNLKALMRFLLVTGRRLSEGVFINTREIDGALWTIPASRTKSGKELLIPLPPMALGILAEAAADETGFYFRSSRTGAPYGRHSVDHACRDLFTPRARRKGKAAPTPPLRGMTPITPHDLRRSCATGMRTIGIARDTVKLVLGHAADDVLGRHYDKHDGLPEKERALRLWEDYLGKLISPHADDIVVPLRAAAQ